jgi:hypothetical protein
VFTPEPATTTAEAPPRSLVQGLDGKTYQRPERTEPVSREQQHAEADVINAFSVLIKSHITPAHIAGLSPAAKTHLVRLLQEAIRTIEGAAA